ncbi:MAG: PilZ domain-containing protein [Deltaproteobacteria bacterium]|nr:PilZ domain-containing protein [Deltaproteobacteria bacterium]
MVAGLKQQGGGESLPPAMEGLYLELAGGRKGQALVCPAQVTGLSAGGVILQTEDCSGKFAALDLTGREAAIRLPHLPPEDLGLIRGRVLWCRSEKDGSGKHTIGLELADPDLQVRKVLEDCLQGCPRDIKELWDQWDRMHARRLLPTGDQAVYLVSLGAVMGGTLLYFLGPDAFQLYGSLLAIYGCLMMAARSAWTMWQNRSVPEE